MKTKPTVLIVDDDENFVAFLDEALKRSGFDVRVAADGSEVEDQLEAGGIDLMLLDLQMPGMNGWEVLRALRRERIGTATSANRRPPKVVVVSGRSEEETEEFVRRLGAQAYLRKPFWARQLVATVRGVLAAG